MDPRGHWGLADIGNNSLAEFARKFVCPRIFSTRTYKTPISPWPDPLQREDAALLTSLPLAPL